MALYVHRDYIHVNHEVSLPGQLADAELLVWVLSSKCPVRLDFSGQRPSKYTGKHEEVFAVIGTAQLSSQTSPSPSPLSHHVVTTLEKDTLSEGTMDLNLKEYYCLRGQRIGFT